STPPTRAINKRRSSRSAPSEPASRIPTFCSATPATVSSDMQRLSESLQTAAGRSRSRASNQQPLSQPSNGNIPGTNGTCTTTACSEAVLAGTPAGKASSPMHQKIHRYLRNAGSWASMQERSRNMPENQLRKVANRIMTELISIIGDGQMALVLADALVERGRRVRLWGPLTEHAVQLATTRRSPRLPGFTLPDSVEVVTDDALVMRDAAVVISAIP